MICPVTYMNRGLEELTLDATNTVFLQSFFLLSPSKRSKSNKNSV